MLAVTTSDVKMAEFANVDDPQGGNTDRRHPKDVVLPIQAARDCDVLDTIGLGKSEVMVKAEPQIVPVGHVGVNAAGVQGVLDEIGVSRNRRASSVASGPANEATPCI
jgi:hypothetical protein